jgi:hypothetical protein
MEKMAFSEVYIGHLGLVTCLFLKASAPDNEYRIFGVSMSGVCYAATVRFPSAC